MTFSPLIDGVVPHRNKYDSRNGAKIFRVILHHWAGVSGGEETLADPNRQASANYLIYSDGRIKGQVPEEFRAWTSGSAAADAPSITFEVQDMVYGEPWTIAPKAMQSIKRLITDIAKRYNWGAVRGSNVRGHREFKATSCPGTYLWSKIPSIVAESNAALQTRPPSGPVTSGNKSRASDEELADLVLQGKFGNGETRKKALGDRYEKVQAIVNSRVMGKKTPTVSKLAKEVIDGKHGNGAERAKSLGARYNEVQAEVNRILQEASDKKAKTPKKNSRISRLAEEVIAGKHGNGEARKKSLGKDYNEVQAEVNRLLDGK